MYTQSPHCWLSTTAKYVPAILLKKKCVSSSVLLSSFVQAKIRSELYDPALLTTLEILTLVLKQMSSQDRALLLSITNKLILHNKAGLDAALWKAISKIG